MVLFIGCQIKLPDLIGAVFKIIYFGQVMTQIHTLTHVKPADFFLWLHFSFPALSPLPSSVPCRKIEISIVKETCHLASTQNC